MQSKSWWGIFHQWTRKYSDFLLKDEFWRPKILPVFYFDMHKYIELWLLQGTTTGKSDINDFKTLAS